MRHTLGLMVAASVACGADEMRDEEIEAQPTSITSPGSGDDDGGGETKLDAGADDGVGNVDPDGNRGCDKVDFLFVVDNSGSMGDEQQALIDSFGPFIQAIDERIGASHDFQIMVTDVDAWVFGECPEACSIKASCEGSGVSCNAPTQECAFPCALEGLCTAGGDYDCGFTQPQECEDVLGAGVTYPHGRDASQQDCGFATGKRYMDANQPDLVDAFACAARVGTGSSADTEKPMEAMVAALRSDGAAAACNEGFLREDAILVVTFITDEDDDPTDSWGTPNDWYAELAEAKNGDDQAIVVLGLFGDNDQPDGICEPLSHDFAVGAEAAPRLREFVGMWGARGHAGSICSGDYAPFFMAAVDSIGQACDDFVPPTE
jgi:hypothetical protein